MSHSRSKRRLPQKSGSSNGTNGILLVLLFAAGFFAINPQYLEQLSKGFNTPTTVATDSPVKPSDAALLNAVAPIQKIAAANPTDARTLSVAFDQFADVYSTSKICKSNADFATLIQRYEAGVIAHQSNLKGKFPGFSEAATKAFKTYLGEEATALDQNKAVAFLEAISWSLANPS